MVPMIDKPELQALPRIRERLSFIYLEYCKINRTDSAVQAINAKGTIDIPVSTIGSLLLGPGTTITHRAMELLGDSGASVIWVGEKGVRYYAYGRNLTHSSLLLQTQAKLVSNTRSRLSVARKMYQMRFPGEDVSHLTLQQLRGRAGSRIRAGYKHWSEETGVQWSGRNYTPDDFQSGDSINQALSSANSCLYGIVHCAIVAMGCSPGLGFIHTGHERSFVYDIADLYKTEITIPISFRIASSNTNNVGSSTRRAVRDAIVVEQLMDRIVSDIRMLLTDSLSEDTEDYSNNMDLWDDRGSPVKSGISYGSDDS
jgi:CRISPR-associated protein Cas1